ncbi:hypothetical protein IEQ34_009152 [Dendrobium chrysotoxum]|uniref:Ubiquitin-like protease family profile domain-containing protein n=1 Tax=Dendrobium chrysotoxum TaxID=161865 RepID=A0AAV7GYG2_DENCH|nr:hypothetical protein IEQ34_009152 [Dendrobium chrysotoxum]
MIIKLQKLIYPRYYSILSWNYSVLPRHWSVLPRHWSVLLGITEELLGITAALVCITRYYRGITRYYRGIGRVSRYYRGITRYFRGKFLGISRYYRGITRNDMIYVSGQVFIYRSQIDELLMSEYLDTNHVDTFGIFLVEKNQMCPGLYLSFLFVSSNHLGYKAYNVDTKGFVSHINKESVSAANLILVPIIENSHWTLLVGNLKTEVWDFYDSLPKKTHRAILPEVIGTREYLHGTIPSKTVPGSATQLQYRVTILSYSYGYRYHESIPRNSADLGTIIGTREYARYTAVGSPKFVGIVMTR